MTDSSRLASFRGVTAERHRGSGQVAKAVGVVAIAAATGALTPLGEMLLPESVSAAANSSGPWALVAFVAIYLSGARGWLAPLLGAASFVAMDVAFFLVFDALGGYYSHTYLAFWLFVGITIGPLVGLCANWLRSPSLPLRALAIAAPSSVLIGEGVYMLHRLPGVSTLYAMTSIALGMGLLLSLCIVLLRRSWWTLVSVAISAVASVAFFAIYGLLPLVLHKTVP